MLEKERVAMKEEIIGVALGRKAAGVRKRRIEEENMVCGVVYWMTRLRRTDLFGSIAAFRGLWPRGNSRSRGGFYPRHLAAASSCWAVPNSQTSKQTSSLSGGISVSQVSFMALLRCEITPTFCLRSHHTFSFLTSSFGACLHTSVFPMVERQDIKYVFATRRDRSDLPLGLLRLS